MDNVKIKSAKIKDGLFLSGSYVEDLPGHSKNKLKFDRTVPIHTDLIDAFAKLNKHFAILTDGIVLPAKVKNLANWEDENLEKFFVDGFTIGGNDENEGVTLIGSHDGTYGSFPLNTPFQKWEASEYDHISDLGSDINACIYEVEQYLFEGKKAPEKQLDMFDDGGEGEENEGVEAGEGVAE